MRSSTEESPSPSTELTRFRPALVFTAALTLAVACSAPNGKTSSEMASNEAASNSTSPPEVEFALCTGVLGPPETPSCLLGSSRTVRLWIEGHGPFSIHSGSKRWTSTDGRPQATGLLFDLDELEPGELVVRFGEPDEPGAQHSEPEWRLRLLAPLNNPLRQRAVELHRAGDSSGAREYLRTELAKTDAGNMGSKADSLSLLARLELMLGNPAAAADRLAESIELYRRRQDLANQIRDLTMLFDVLNHEGDLVTARQTLEQMPETPAGCGESRFTQAFYRGYWATYAGDSRTALRQFSRAAEQARRLAMGPQERMTVQMQAQEWSFLGRHAEALAAIEAVAPGETSREDPCQDGDVLNDIAWNRLLILEAERGMAGDGPPPPADELDPIAELLHDALAKFTDCDDPRKAEARLNLALLALHSHRPQDADPHLAWLQGRQASLSLRQALWKVDLEGRLALATGRANVALERFEELAKLASTLLSPDGDWRASLGLGLAYEALGEPAAALEAYRRAEAHLDGASLRVPIDEGRQTSVAVREAGTRRLLDLLLRQGLESEAFDVARRARTRYLRGLMLGPRVTHLSVADQARWSELLEEVRQKRAELHQLAEDAWRFADSDRQDLEQRLESGAAELREDLDAAFLLLDERQDLSDIALPALRPGELTLLYHPLPTGWAGFAAEDSNLEVHRFESVPRGGTAKPARLARLLEPFREAISRTGRLRILPYGFLRDVDFHALPLDGQPLIEHRPVVYGLDLPAAVEETNPVEDRIPSSTADPSTRRAWVLADPTDTLLHAPREARRVEARLQQRGWRIDVEGALDPADALDKLARFDRFHFAGHADFSGRGGWDSGLRLTASTGLEVGDLLAASKMPRSVVLSACDSGRGSDEGHVEGLGLAQAFLLAGSHEVVGAMRTVDDVVSKELIEAFYDAWGDGTSAAEALRLAQLELRSTGPDTDWASFRVIEK